MGLFRNITVDQVKDLNLRDPVVVTKDARTCDVVRAMRQKGLGCAVLVDDDQKPIGMFTENMVTNVAAKADANWGRTRWATRRQ